MARDRPAKFFKALLPRRREAGEAQPAVAGVAQPLGSGRAPRFAKPMSGPEVDDEGEDGKDGEGDDFPHPSAPALPPSNGNGRSNGITQHTSRFAAPPDQPRAARLSEGEIENGELVRAVDAAVRRAGEGKRAAEKLVAKLGRKHDDVENVVACAERLGEQVVWLEGHRPLLAGLPLPSADTLNRMYDRAHATLSDAQYRAPTWTDRQQSALATLVRILDGGPRYLFVLALLEALAWQVELVRADVGEEVQDVVEGLKERREEREGLKSAIKTVKTALRGIPKDSITDRKAKAAWSQCVKLLDALNETVTLFPKESSTMTLASESAPKPILKASSAKVATETIKTPDGGKISASRAASVASSIGTAVTAKTTQSDDADDDDAELEPQLYNWEGQVVTESAMELLEEEARLVERGLYERDGVLITASALSLLQAQEMLERGDSAGHGEWGRALPSVKDDEELVVLDIGGQYIPKWARKLTVADQWPLVDDDGKRLRDQNGKPLEDWFDVNLDAVDEHHAMHFGLEGVVPYPY